MLVIEIKLGKYNLLIVRPLSRHTQQLHPLIPSNSDIWLTLRLFPAFRIVFAVICQKFSRIKMSNFLFDGSAYSRAFLIPRYRRNTILIQCIYSNLAVPNTRETESQSI